MANDSNNNRGSNTGNTSNRGFASMDQDKQREIASKGGRAAHQQGAAHEWNSEEARAAGKKGGQASRGNTSQLSENQGNTQGHQHSSQQGNQQSHQQGENQDNR